MNCYLMLCTYNLKVFINTFQYYNFVKPVFSCIQMIYEWNCGGGVTIYIYFISPVDKKSYAIDRKQMAVLQ